MLQLRPTFSESWYRVKDLKARLRPGAQISRQYYRGERWYVVRDPAGNQFHRLSDPAYRFVGLLDGRRNVQEAWDLCGGHLADDAPTQPEVIQILSQLHAANLIETNVTADADVLLRRFKNMKRKQFQGRLMNIMFPRIPIWDPDRFLKTWMPVMNVFLSRWGVLLWLGVIITAILMLVPEWQALQVAAANSIAPHNWPYLWATFVVIKFVHEMGHAFGCRRFGGECHELGIMFLVFIPTPYVDASTAWAFPSRWQRIFVGAAGMIFELFVAALCAFVWLNTTPGVPILGIPVNELAYNAMLIASVSTVVFNANPLLRYDGYYMLSDYLEIPNLQKKSSEYCLGLIKRHIFRVKQQQPLPPIKQRIELFLYGITSTCYRVFVGVMIIVVVANQVPVLGVLMAIGGVITWLVVPAVKLFKYLTIDAELHRKRAKAWAFTGLVTATVLVVIGLVPFPTRVYATGMVEPFERTALYTEQSGWVSDLRAVDGAKLKAGDIILVASDPMLDAEIKGAQARVKSASAKATQSLANDPAQRQIDLLTLDLEKQKLQDALRRRNELTIKAPIDGLLIAPQLRDLQGQFVPRGTQLATVAQFDRLLIRANIEQRDAELLLDKPQARALAASVGHETSTTPTTLPVKKGIDNQVRLAGLISRPLNGDTDVLVIHSAQEAVVHPSLTHQGGEEIAPDPSDPRGMKTLVPQFEAHLTLANPTGDYLSGQRAYIRFTVEDSSLLWQWGRRFLQLIQTHSNSKWM